MCKISTGMFILIVFILFQTILMSNAAEFNKSCTTLNINYKTFKDTDIFDVSEYGYDIYIEASHGIIHKETFADIPKILRFMVYNCNFTSFDLTSLYRMTNLESVDLMDVTGLPVLTNNLMLGFKSLKRLSMYHTDVKFDHNTFQHLMHLEYLSISKVDVSILGNDVFVGSNLKELYWTDSGIEKIDKYCFSPLKKIEIINLSGNKIDYLPPETFMGLKFLERLYLNRNKLTYINFRHLEYLPSLIYLDISLNKIDEIKLEDVQRSLPHLKTIVVDKKGVSASLTADKERILNVIVV